MVLNPVRRRRPVFVTSTFRDMRAERECLGTSVFPELDERLRRRHHRLEPIDLRWHVEADTADRQPSQELWTLKVCLQEIARARPLHIVLLGDHYGWVPPPARTQAVIQEAGFEADPAGKSLVALEIEFALRGNPDSLDRPFFYFREPLDYDNLPQDVALAYRDAAQADKLAELKERIERQMPDRVRRYRAEWDEESKTLTGLDDFGRMVLEDLWQVLDDETRAYDDSPPPGWQDEQRWLLDRFVEARSRGFVSRGELVDRLVGLARSPSGEGQPWGACVTGVSGAGKSALFAHLHRALGRDAVILLAHAAGAGVRSIQLDAMLRRWTPELARALQLDVPISDASTSREVEKSFARLLTQASDERRVVLLIDALDRFEPTPRAQRLTWLPDPWPENARLIATTSPGPASEALERRAGVEIVPLAPLAPEEAHEMAEAVCGRRRRPLEPEVLDVLLSKQLPGGAPAAGMPLWLESALEELILLDADDVVRAGRGSVETAQEQLDELVLDTARELPADVEALYDWVLKRNEELLGPGWVSGFVNLIAASRNGLRESEFEALLPKVAKLFVPTAPRRPWDGLKFAVLRRAFRAHVAQGGADGAWDFRHAKLREAIRRRNARDPQLVHRLHTSIAYHLKSLPASDPLRQTELMVHLIGSEDRLRAAHYYSGELPDEELAGATQALADHILAGSNQRPNEGLGWTASLLIEPKLDRSQKGVLCRRFNSHLLDALANNAPVDARRRLADATRQAAGELAEQDPENPQWQQDSVTSYRKLAEFHEEAGNQTEAETCWRRCRDTLFALRAAHVPLDRPLVDLLNHLEQRL
ncbi:MAG TPA: AAA family ATPase [Thermoguttaceae bacterium]|nr:AAA family ATPase [Thermoguttaceae bacterium]